MMKNPASLPSYQNSELLKLVAHHCQLVSYFLNFLLSICLTVGCVKQFVYYVVLVIVIQVAFFLFVLVAGQNKLDLSEGRAKLHTFQM